MFFPRFLPAILVVVLIQVLASISFAERFYVSDDASAGGDGASWETAFTFLQDALDQTVAGRGDEVWIEAGTYYPDDGANVTEGDRTASFTLVDGVAMYGGFAGVETSAAQRDWETNKSVLSGEIFEEQIFWSLHVSNASGSVTLDGVTVTRGNANGSVYPDFTAAAVLDLNSNVLVRNCVFSDNSAAESGGVALQGKWTVIDSVFSGNYANATGGVTKSGEWTVINSEFSGNYADQNGGVTGGGTWIVEDSIFVGNAARLRGGVAYRSDWTVTNSQFAGNSVEQDGGVCYQGDWTVTNNQFIGNSARLGGVSENSIWEVTNSVFSGNFAEYGGVGYAGDWTVTNSSFIENSTSSVGCCNAGGVASLGVWKVTNSSFFGNTSDGGRVANGGTWKLSNCIVWGDTNFVFNNANFTNLADEPFQTPDTPRAFNIIEGGSSAIYSEPNVDVNIGEGYILDIDPSFTDASDPDGADDIWGTADDGMRLQPESPAIGQGNLQFLSLDSQDLDEDGVTDEPTPFDLAGFTRIQDGSLDLGAYEFGDETTPQYTLTVSSNTGGSTKWDGANNFYEGVQLNITATNENGYVFDSWSGDESGTENPLSIVMDGNKTIAANFSQDTSDSDEDGLTAYQEYVVYGTDPNESDTSGDGLSDGVLVSRGVDPTIDYTGVLNEVSENPNDYGLFSPEDVSEAEAASRTLGQQDVISSPQTFELATTAQVEAAAEAARTIVNVSARVALGEGELVTPGFVVLGEQKKMLIRAVGPKLADLGVGSPLPNPTMTVYKTRYDGNPPDVVAIIDDWKEQPEQANGADVAAINAAMATAGAFPLEPTETFQGRPFMTDDTSSAATLVTLDVGVYTVQVSSADDGVGEVLVEVYEIME
jgi:uncharacterized repeat protein (TIGR02543 family)